MKTELTKNYLLNLEKTIKNSKYLTENKNIDSINDYIKTYALAKTHSLASYTDNFNVNNKRIWKKILSREYNDTCLITGLKNQATDFYLICHDNTSCWCPNLSGKVNEAPSCSPSVFRGAGSRQSIDVSVVGHHLYSQKGYPFLSKNVFNGIMIEKNLHIMYHKTFGKNAKSTTPDSFIELIKYLKTKKGYYVAFKKAQKINVNKKGGKLDFYFTEDDTLVLFIPLDLNRLNMAISYVNYLKSFIYYNEKDKF